MSDDQSVLFVEDEDLIRELTASELEEAGYGVVVVESGDDALEALDGNADPFCVLVTDINLADGTDGWDVGRRAHRNILLMQDCGIARFARHNRLSH